MEAKNGANLAKTLGIEQRTIFTHFNDFIRVREMEKLQHAASAIAQVVGASAVEETKGAGRIQPGAVVGAGCKRCEV